MNVFVLCTGRNGSVTFVRACGHMQNYTAAHESRVHELGAERLAFEDNHIEADNRLSWFLGRIDKKYGDEAFYVHLIRDRAGTANSYNQRWVRERSIINAYTKGILMRPKEQGIEFCEDMYDTINENIEAFLKDKTKKMVLRLETVKADFAEFWQAIGAEGDLNAALAEWDIRNNANEYLHPWPIVQKLQGFIKKHFKS